MPGPVAHVLVPVALEGPYSYRVPAGMSVEPGSIVAVPLGPRRVFGAVWDGAPETTVGDNRLRDIEGVFDVPPLDATMRRFVDWVARYYMMPRGSVLRMVLRVPEALDPERPIAGVRRAGPAPERLTAERRRVLALLEDGVGWSRGGLAASASVSSSVVDGLLAHGTLEAVDLPPPPAVRPPEVDHAPPVLDAGQTEVAAALRAAVAARAYSVEVVEGVTGSGKTEVYFEAVAEAIRAGRQAAVLLPEIALTGQFLDRFEARFGARPGEWHSDVAPKQRARLWRGIATGEVPVVVGARSALFLPFRDLGLIVVDEEHDGAYKQEDRVPYNARDMAVLRGHLGRLPVVLVSATPSIETRANVEAGRYRRHALPGRVGGGALPELFGVDLRREKPPKGAFLAPRLAEAIDAAVERGEQALLFLNRRGYAPLTVCRACGHRFQCPNCTTWMVDHRFRGQLVCHQCGHAERRPEACPVCGDLDGLVACGPGVERIAEEVAERFPGRHVVLLSSDMPGGTQRLRQELDAIARGEAEIVIGTQLVAKGHNFPKLTCVGVVDADLGLAHGDPRAAERTFQLVQQVTGRAGRFMPGGRAFVQTRAPEHPVMRAILSGDAESFYERELDERRLAGLPPYGRLVALTVSDDHREGAFAHARALAAAWPAAADLMLFGPAEAPIAVVRGRHRFRLLLKAPRGFDVQDHVRRWLAQAPRPKGGARVQIDVDPQSFS